MLVEASITGLVKTILIIIGVMVVLRFINQVFTAKKSQAEHKEFEKNKKIYEKAKKVVKENEGKVRVLNKNENAHGDAEYVDYEEIKD